MGIEGTLTPLQLQRLEQRHLRKRVKQAKLASQRRAIAEKVMSEVFGYCKPELLSTAALLRLLANRLERDK